MKKQSKIILLLTGTSLLTSLTALATYGLCGWCAWDQDYCNICHKTQSWYLGSEVFPTDCIYGNPSDSCNTTVLSGYSTYDYYGSCNNGACDYTYQTVYGPGACISNCKVYSGAPCSS